MDPHADPLRPSGTVSRDQLERYVLGQLDASERHRIELHLEQDPLLRDALEGLQEEGAVAGLQKLQGHRPGGPAPAMRMLLIGGVILMGLVAIVLLVKEEPARPSTPEVVAVVADRPFRADSAIAEVGHDLEAAEPLPVTQQIGHAPVPSGPEPVIDTTTVRIMEPRIDTIPMLISQPSPAPLPARPMSNRKLVFVHDLKLVDPKELYDKGPLIMETGGVPAGYADGHDRNARTEAPRTMRYLDLMDMALGKFVRNDHKGCLQDLLFLMGQYPKDINARFYAGLCCYNLGLQDRAKAYLSAVTSDPIDTFREEAEWYLALTIERLEGPAAARPRFEQVKAGGGGYAQRAAEKLEP